MTNTVTRDELVGILTERKGAQPVTITVEVKARLNKKNRETKEKCPFVNVTKVSRVNGFIGWIYTNSVNNQRGREGQKANFEAQPRKWGERLAGTPLVAHKGKLYVELKVEKALATEYFADGEKVDVEVLVPYLPPRRNESGRQGVEKAIILRDYGLAGIKEITINGELFVVES